jgi:hypothetical protein
VHDQPLPEVHVTVESAWHVTVVPPPLELLLVPPSPLGVVVTVQPKTAST